MSEEQQAQDRRINGWRTIVISLLLVPFFPPAWLSLYQRFRRNR